MVIGMSVFSVFNSKNTRQPIDTRELWKHALGTSIAAEAAAARAEIDQGSLVQLSGLMHDIGKVFFLAFFPDEYRKAVSDADQKQQSLYRSEEVLLGITHGDLAGLLMTHWNFPEALIVPCRFHHHLEKTPQAYKLQTALVSLADNLCLQANVGFSGSPVVELNKELLAILNLSDRDCEETTPLEGQMMHRQGQACAVEVSAAPIGRSARPSLV